MEPNIKQEALLRHLLNTRNCATKDEFLYSVLLGFRLFLSPRQLLMKLNSLTNEDITSTSQQNFAENVCPGCGQKQKKTTEVKPAKKTVVEAPKEIGFEPKRIVSMLFPLSSGESSHRDGVDTLRRNRRGRVRNQNESLPEADEGENISKVACLSTSSRDSGIISAILDINEMETNQHASSSSNNNKNSVPFCKNLTLKDRYCLRCTSMTQNETTLARKQQLVHILHEWVRHFPADFRNKKTMWTLNDVIRSCQNENEDVSSVCTDVIDCISRLTALQESYEQQITDMEEFVLDKTSIKFRKTTDWMLQLVLNMKDSINVTEMAQQLCLVETDFLKHVGAEEFLQLFTADGDEDEKSNLGACVRWFNRLSHLVATIICLCRKQKQAKQVITFFARVANRCFELSNFNSSMAILTGLSLGPVIRLKKVWDKLELTELEKLQSVFDPSNNFLKYRSIYFSRADKLQSSPIPDNERQNYDENRFSVASVASASSLQGDSGVECDHEMKPPNVFHFQEAMKHFTFDPAHAPQDSVMVPFLVLLVKDVYFLNHSIGTVNEDGSINFEKLHTLSHILRPLEEWKQMTSTYQKQDDLQDFLLRAPIHNDDELYLLSYKREPPTNRFEKQQLKSLKMDQGSSKSAEVAAT